MNHTTHDHSLLDIAGRVDAMVHDELRRSEDPFTLENARLYGLDESGDVRLVGEGRDPYEMMLAFEPPTDAIAAVVVVTGWAAPHEENGQPAGRPSEHPKAERIRLVVAVGDAGLAAVMRKKSQPELLITMDERGVGDLPEALESWWTLA